MIRRNRVVVTGMGVLAPNGIGLEEFWESLIARRSGIGPITLFDASHLKNRIAGEVKNFNPLLYIVPRETRHMDRSVQFAVAASREAIQDAGLEINPEKADRIGVIAGAAVGAFGYVIEQMKVLEERGPRRVGPFGANGLPNSASSQLAITFGARGPNMTVVSACASGGHAIGEAAETIRRIKRGQVEKIKRPLWLQHGPPFV